MPSTLPSTQADAILLSKSRHNSPLAPVFKRRHCTRAMSAPNAILRREVIAVYKELLHLGKDYPLGFDYFRPRLHKAFMSNSHLRDEDAIRNGIARADFVRKEIEALYYLKRYRTLRKRYGGS
ncbi:hypothetical protein BX600DRAFT_97434 [Xylariales sp. PMI_506]|nr:hypothetical protein BX600DRAFT_97434 [Xylariales sp. PMI_506]